jgi:hypothetical protein
LLRLHAITELPLLINWPPGNRLFPRRDLSAIASKKAMLSMYTVPEAWFISIKKLAADWAESPVKKNS